MEKFLYRKLKARMETVDPNLAQFEMEWVTPETLKIQQLKIALMQHSESQVAVQCHARTIEYISNNAHRAIPTDIQTLCFQFYHLPGLVIPNHDCDMLIKHIEDEQWDYTQITAAGIDNIGKSGVYNIGDRVKLINNATGTIRYKGKVYGGMGANDTISYGIELDEKSSNYLGEYGDGQVGHYRFFTTQPGFATFVEVHGIIGKLESQAQNLKSHLQISLMIKDVITCIRKQFDRGHVYSELDGDHKYDMTVIGYLDLFAAFDCKCKGNKEFFSGHWENSLMHYSNMGKHVGADLENNVAVIDENMQYFIAEKAMFDKYKVIAFNNSAGSYLKMRKKEKKKKKRAGEEMKQRMLEKKAFDKASVVLKIDSTNQKALLRLATCYLEWEELDAAKDCLIRAAGGIESFQRIINGTDNDASVIKRGWVWFQQIRSKYKNKCDEFLFCEV